MRDSAGVVLDKLQQGVQVTCCLVLGLPLSISEEHQCWVTMDTMAATQILLHCAVHLGRGGGGGGEIECDLVNINLSIPGYVYTVSQWETRNDGV